MTSPRLVVCFRREGLIFRSVPFPKDKKRPKACERRPPLRRNAPLFSRRVGAESAAPAAEGTRARFLGGQRAHHPMGRPRVCAHIPYPSHPFPFRAAGRGSADPDQHGSNGSDGRTRHARALLPDANCSSAYIRVCLMTLVPRSLRCACGRCVGAWARWRTRYILAMPACASAQEVEQPRRRRQPSGRGGRYPRH